MLKDSDAMDMGSVEREWREWQGYDDEGQQEYAGCLDTVRPILVNSIHIVVRYLIIV